MNARTLLAALIALGFVLGAPAPGLAQDPPEPDKEAQEPKKEEPKKDEPKKDEPKKDDKKKDPKVAEFEKAIKDLKKTEGAFTFYQRKKDLLLELPESKLDQIFFIQASMATGVSSILLQAGDPIGSNEIDAFRFERHDDQAWLVRPNFRYRWSKEDELKTAAERSLPEAILGSFRIEQTEPEKKLLLINLGTMFYGDLFQLSEAVGFVLGGQYGLDRDKSGIETVKGFPENTIVQSRLHYYSPRGAEGNALLEALGFTTAEQLEDTRSVPMKVTYNLWFRKDTGYRPRLADPRVGYFSTDFYSLEKFLNPTRTERYINRFNLEKKDPKAAVSEPVKPLVWTLDPSIPPTYRDAVKEGILRWNRAYEEIGYKDAIRVEDAPKDDYDHSDARRNVIRWTMSPEAGYAISLTRVDPFTGEILNASISVDANMVAYIVDEYQHATSPIARGSSARALQALVRDPERKIADEEFLWEGERAEALRQLENGLGKFGWQRNKCEAQYGLAMHAAFGWNAMRGTTLGVSKEEYAKKFIADVVSHEVGHCLGLRHNFVASTYLTTDQLADDALTAKDNVAASVMDYTPVNIQAVLKGKGNFFATTIGPYDRWAVKYGYSDIPGTTPLSERPELARIASKSGLPGHAYMTDENADGWDPYVATFDNAADPIQYASKNLVAAKRMRDYAIQKLPKPGESYERRTQLVLSSILRSFREGRSVARFVGGVRSSRTFRGDAGEKPTLQPVAPDAQRQAMRLAVQSCFSPTAFDLPSNVLGSLSLDPAAEASARWNAPLRDIIGGQQMALYATLMSAATTDRIAENAFKWGARKDAYTMDEHFGLLLGAVFKEVGVQKSVAPLRRDLQRFALSALMQQAGAPQGAISDDARTVASDALKRLSSRLGAASKAKDLDGMTRVHFRDANDNVQRFLNRQIATPR